MLGGIAFWPWSCPKSLGVSFGTLYCMLGETFGMHILWRSARDFRFCEAWQRLVLFGLFVAAAMQRICNEWGGMRSNHHRLPAQILAQVLGTDYTYVTPIGVFVTFGADYHDDCCMVERPTRRNSPPPVINVGHLCLLCSVYPLPLSVTWNFCSVFLGRFKISCWIFFAWHCAQQGSR